MKFSWLVYPVFCDIDLNFFFVWIYLDMIQIKFDFWRVETNGTRVIFFCYDLVFRTFSDVFYDIDIQLPNACYIYKNSRSR